MRGLRAAWGGVSTSPSPEVGWWERTGLRDWGRQPGSGGCRWVTTLRSPRDPRGASADGLVFGRARIFSEGPPETLGRPRHRAPPLQRHLVAAAGPWAGRRDRGLVVPARRSPRRLGPTLRSGLPPPSKPAPEPRSSEGGQAPAGGPEPPALPESTSVSSSGCVSA